MATKCSCEETTRENEATNKTEAFEENENKFKQPNSVEKDNSNK